MDFETVRQRLLGSTVGALSALLTRQTSGYPYLDTKFNIASGRSFPAHDPIRSRETIYSWIQGRGLEALCAHGKWLRRLSSIPQDRRGSLLSSIDKIIPPLVSELEKVRRAHGGRLPFAFHQSGIREKLETNATSMSDLFYSKGLVAAGAYFGNDEWIAIAEELFGQVSDDIRKEHFQLGQVAFDPKNRVEPVPGRRTHAGRMIGIGAATVFLRSTGRESYHELGKEFIAHVLKHHSFSPAEGREDRGGFQEGDFWEFTDLRGQPWTTESGEVFSDPGHATEFVGLAFSHLEECGLRDAVLEERLAGILLQNFQNGYTGRGIVKAFDLRARKAINTDMPWWSLPETMRAAALAASRCEHWQGEEQGFVEIFRTCETTFSRNYLAKGTHDFAVQTLDQNGGVSSAIPAIPDADPCYHTGLCLMECLRWIENRPALLQSTTR